MAIRIAAARLRSRPHWPIAHLAERLSRERHRLAELRVGDLDVRATFVVSYRNLTPGEAALFRRLGIVPAAEFDAHLAGALASDEADEADEADLVLESLADAHLIEAATPGRYRIHDLLRLFARERLGRGRRRSGVPRPRHRMTCRARPKRAETHARQAYQVLRTVDPDAAKEAQALLFRAARRGTSPERRQEASSQERTLTRQDSASVAQGRSWLAPPH